MGFKCCEIIGGRIMLLNALYYADKHVLDIHHSYNMIYVGIIMMIIDTYFIINIIINIINRYYQLS